MVVEKVLGATEALAEVVTVLSCPINLPMDLRIEAMPDVTKLLEPLISFYSSQM